MTSLGSTAAFRAFVIDQLEDLGDVTPRSMFGGVGLYQEYQFLQDAREAIESSVAAPGGSVTAR